MPVWLGVIMLIGIVVNNAIVLVEYVELLRGRGAALVPAVVEAARLRLRPILMTTLTTVVGMSPLALGLGAGSEMLQPLAVCMVFGLLFSMFVRITSYNVCYTKLLRLLEGVDHQVLGVLVPVLAELRAPHAEDHHLVFDSGRHETSLPNRLPARPSRNSAQSRATDPLP